ncbi:MAG: phloretin hydrolase [Spirochaetota bacterium]
MSLPKLSEQEALQPYASYYYRPLSPIPPEIIQKLEKGPLDSNHALRFEDINRLLEPGYLNDEIGYCIMPDGSGFASMLTIMPGVTGTMLDWWFVWHPQEPLRYKIWYPGAHISNSVNNSKRLNDKSLPLHERNFHITHYPVENIGKGVEKLSITFVPPEEFGFDVSRFSASSIETVICGVVGYPGLNVQHTYIVHCARKINSGIELRSRFWLGYHIRFNTLSPKSIINRIANTSIVKKCIISQKIAKNMAYHCAQEYHNLAHLLPELYTKYGKPE